MHGQLNLKPFTVSFLDPLAALARVEGRHSDRFYWRVTGLNAEILDAAFSVPVGYELQAGAREMLAAVDNCASWRRKFG